MRGLAALVLVLTAAEVLAVSPERRCQDRALFAYFAADARDRGVSLDRYLGRIERLVREHPEYGVPVSDLPAMLGLARIAYASRDSAPDDVRERVFRQCMDEHL